MKEVNKADGTTSKIILTIHVDNAIVATNDDQFYAEFLTELGKDFELKRQRKVEMVFGVQGGAGSSKRHRAHVTTIILQRCVEAFSNV